MSEKLKIVHIISNLSLGGAQTLLLDIVLNLKQEENTEVSVITLDSGEYMKKFRESGINVIDLKEKGLVNFRIPGKLNTILKELKPDVVHTHLQKADFYGRISAKQTKVPLIISTCHNYSTHHKGADVEKVSLFDRIDNAVIRYSGSYLISISDVVKRYLINRNKNFGSITEVIYNGVSIEKEKYLLSEDGLVKFRDNHGISKDDFVILVSGRLEPQKGHLFFLSSVKDFLNKRKNAKVIVLGEGSMRKQIEEQIKNDQLGEQVQLLGFRVDAEPFIEIADLVCVPSLWEGFGLVTIEGMIKKKIVLASDVGGIPEIIQDGVTGFLFRVSDKNDFLNKLDYIYEKRRNLQEIKKNAIDSVKEKFDIKVNTQKYYDFYLSKLKTAG
jgi:glycosyltransferase involved in cell wall biosynthesis